MCASARLRVLREGARACACAMHIEEVRLVVPPADCAQFMASCLSFLCFDCAYHAYPSPIRRWLHSESTCNWCAASILIVIFSCVFLFWPLCLFSCQDSMPCKCLAALVFRLCVVTSSCALMFWLCRLFLATLLLRSMPGLCV